MFCNPGKDFRIIRVTEEVSTEVGVVADEDARVKLAREEMLPGIVEEGLDETLKAYSLVDVA